MKVLEFLIKETGNENLNEDTDLFNSGIVGDDFHDLMDKYWDTYKIDMKTYLWYFHCDEDGQNLGGLFNKPPYKRVERIPSTPKKLSKFVEIGRWSIKYPEHKLPRRRYDIIINQVLVAGFGILVLYILITWILIKLL